MSTLFDILSLILLIIFWVYVARALSAVLKIEKHLANLNAMAMVDYKKKQQAEQEPNV